MQSVTRRAFVRGAAALAAGVPVLRGQTTTGPGGGSAESTVPLRGFIVSDAHFGWNDEQQPTPEQQAQAMQRIMRRFPELDAFFDTGDAHHNGDDRDRERGQWSDIIAGGCGTVPFYYVPGNHEICHARDADVEQRCNVIGSASCRPYYSVDLLGIHFVSLPELTRAVYLTRESLEWLALDLELSRERTTILLSHNNIRGTTTGDEPGYRGLVQSEEMLALLDRYPNILAWMHGHNHNFEVVSARGKLFVSNGRIGGFDPSRGSKEGSHGLGGIYFEVAPDCLSVRCYSATRQCFLDELGIPAVQAVLQARTTLDRTAPAACSYGIGGARDGQRTPIWHHHSGASGRTRIAVCGTADGVFNDDPDFALHTVRRNARKEDRQLMGSSIQGAGQEYTWLDPGLRIEAARGRSRSATLVIPRQGHAQYTYYRCPPNRDYRATVDLDAGPGGQMLQLTALVHDTTGRELARIPGPAWTLAPGRQSREFVARVPAISDVPNIYTNPSEGGELHLMMQAELSSLAAPVDIRRFALACADARGPSERPTVVIAGRPVAFDGAFTPAQIAKADVAAPSAPRDVVELHVQGNRRATWLVTHANLDWQVRNAPVVQNGDTLTVGPLRNRYSPRREVILAPLKRGSVPSFVHRLRGVDVARIELPAQGKPRLVVELTKLLGAAEVELVLSAPPRRVIGADGQQKTSTGLILSKNQPGRLEVDLT